MVKPTNQKTIAIENLAARPQDEDARPWRDHTEKYQLWSGGRGGREGIWGRATLWLPQTGQRKTG